MRTKIVVVMAVIGLMAVNACEHNKAAKYITGSIRGSCNVDCTIAVQSKEDFNFLPKSLNSALGQSAVFSDLEVGNYIVSATASADYLSTPDREVIVAKDVESESIFTFTKVNINGGDNTDVVVVNPVDLGPDTVKVVDANSEIQSECDNLSDLTTGFITGTVTRDALVTAEGKCQAAKESGVRAYNTLSALVSGAPANNPGFTEAQNALIDLQTAIEAADEVIVEVNAALNAPVAPHGNVIVRVAIPASNGQPAGGVSVEVQVTLTDIRHYTTTDSNPVLTVQVPVGSIGILAMKDGLSSATACVAVANGETANVFLNLSLPPQNPVAGNLVQQTDIAMAINTIRSMSGKFQYWDSTLTKQTIPDSEIILSIVPNTGTTVTVTGLALNSGASTGATQILVTWLHAGVTKTMTFFVVVAPQVAQTG